MTVALVPLQTVVVVDEILTTGGGITMIVTDPDCGWLQLGVPALATPTRLNTVVVV